MHLPLLSVRQTVSALAPWQPRLGRNNLVSRAASRALWSVLTPLVLGSAIAPAAVLLPSLPAQAQSSQTIMIQRSLRLGDRGADVLQLQQALVQRGLLDLNIPRNAWEGYFGPATKAALQSYQRSEQDLRADGILGEATFRRLFAVGLMPTEAYSIALMQAQLSELGYYRSGLDGEFGPVTRQALEDLRDETFIPLETRAGGLENTFEVVSGYYARQRQTQDLPHPDILEARVERQVPQSELWGYGSSWDGAVSSVSFGADSASAYRAILPLGRDNDAAELSALRTLVGSVMVTENRRLGAYAQVGAYGERRNAEEMVTFLRAKGFDARVVYD